MDFDCFRAKYGTFQQFFLCEVVEILVYFLPLNIFFSVLHHETLKHLSCGLSDEMCPLLPCKEYYCLEFFHEKARTAEG